MALTMVAKLSSSRTMSEASLVTSVPLMPMATPMSAALRAGASLTPSPVMATMWPSLFRLRAMRILCSGLTLANTRTSSMRSSSSSSVSSSTSAPSMTEAGVSSSMMPISLAMATAVILWSPVTMTERMPAPWAVLMARGTSSLAGSIIPIMPTNVRPDSTASTSRFWRS